MNRNLVIRNLVRTTLTVAGIAASSLPAFAAVVSQSTPAAGAAVTQSIGATMQVIPPALRPVFYKSLSRDAGATYHVNAKGCATLPGAGLTACFDGSGAHFTGAGALSLHLTGYGRGEALSSVKAVKPEIEANRVSYAHGNLTEWWRVLPIGFEQGFTLNKRPTGHGELTLALTTSRQNACLCVSARRQAGAPTEAGHQDTLTWGKLRYGNLVITDAKGKVVPATLKTKGNRILIAVNDAHAAYPLTVDPLVWLEQKVTASDGAPGNAFGISAALAGTTALVGAYAATVKGNVAQGEAYVFTESNGTWSQTQTLTASNGVAQNYFGISVGLSGTTALIGAFGVNAEQGAAYVFTESGGSWTQTAELTASDGVAGDAFGATATIDGTTALISSEDATVNGNPYVGKAYIFTESDGTWSQQAELTASDGGAANFFGQGLGLSGTTAIVGAYFATVNGNPGQGAAYVFSDSGGTWTQTQKLTASDGGESDEFGFSVALAGTTALIGAYEDPVVNGNPGPGAAYVFTNSGGTWTQTQKLTASDGEAADFFGDYVTLSLSGTTALIGASDATVNGNGGQGAAYVFTNSGGTWTQTQKLIASDGAANDIFGDAVALSGATALVGEPYAVSQGAAYFYGESDLGFAVSAPETIGQGQQYTSQTIATNNASAASPAVSATVTVPAAASFISATATQGSCSEASGVVTCDFGQIPGNAGTATANVTFKATGSPGTTINNTASVALAQPALTASAPTQITQSTNCPEGYTVYMGTLASHANVHIPSYQAPAGEENAELTAPAGFQLYWVVRNPPHGAKVYRSLSYAVHRWGPAGTYSWVVRAGATGGAYTFCLLHP